MAIKISKTHYSVLENIIYLITAMHVAERTNEIWDAMVHKTMNMSNLAIL